MKKEASGPGSEAERIRDLVVAPTLKKLTLSLEDRDDEHDPSLCL
jgi:hypothetical protein